MSFLSSSRVLLFLLISLLCQTVRASSTPRALSVTPSTTWYGDDGTWSAISIRVGSPQQWVDVMVSTASSETWVISPFGCGGSSICKSKRGGLFDFNKSSTWHHEGMFELGLDTQLGFTGYADYGLDILEFGTTGVYMNNSIIGSINSTEYWLGYFGLGIVPGNFTTTEALSPISGLVETEGSIPSHSYGFTAGANYQQKGEPCSLTLGGFDANRFIPHDISFELNPLQQPEAFLSSISVVSDVSTGKAPNWSSNPLQLLAAEDGISVAIDSSTPFLWLPKSICDRFAHALGLTYNDSLAVYTFDGNASTPGNLRAWNLNFTFSLSDKSRSSQVVEITLPYAAFDLQLTYPFIPNTTYENGNKYYFPLRQAANETQYTLGRAFLQETYIITDYERNNFSVHQAVHIENPLGNTSIVDITRPSTSQFSGVAGETTSSRLSTTNIILISIGIVLFLVLLTLIFIVFRRRRGKRIARAEGSQPVNPPAASGTSEKPEGIWRTERANSTSVTEVSAGADAQRFELAVPYMPVELDGVQVLARRYEQDDNTLSDRSPNSGIESRYRSVPSSSYSPVSSPGRSVAENASPLSQPPTSRTMSPPPMSPPPMSPPPMSPPPIYQSPSTRAQRSNVMIPLPSNIDEPEPNHKFLRAEMGRGRMGGTGGDSKS